MSIGLVVSGIGCPMRDNLAVKILDVKFPLPCRVEGAIPIDFVHDGDGSASATYTSLTGDLVTWI